MMEDLVVLRDIQGLGFDTLSWLKDRSQWLNVCKSTTVVECWIGTSCWSYCGLKTPLPVTVEGIL